MFKELVQYCSKNNVFDNYEDALKAYNIHCQRQSLRNCVDPLKEFYTSYHKTVRTYFRKKRQHRFYKFYTYDFNDVKSFLGKNHLFGMQVFDCHSNEDTDMIYSKDGVVICYSSYGYIDVVGLRPCDFYVIEALYNKKYSTTE